MTDDPVIEEDQQADESEGQPPLCPDVQTWVEHIYVTTYIRRIGSHTRWCARWWDHAEAIVRLTALWQTWETARLATDGHGMADWLRTYLDVINPPLLDASGPFASCTPERHQPQDAMYFHTTPTSYWSVA